MLIKFCLFEVIIEWQTCIIKKKRKEIVQRFSPFIHETKGPMQILNVSSHISLLQLAIGKIRSSTCFVTSYR